MQRGRTAKPRSAAIIAKVSPVLSQVPPKHVNARSGQPRPPTQEPLPPQPPPQQQEQQQQQQQQQSTSHFQCPSDQLEEAVVLQKPIPEPLEKSRSPENGDVLEVLMVLSLFLSLHSLSPLPPTHQLFTARVVTVECFTRHICFCFGLGGIHGQTVQIDRHADVSSAENPFSLW